MLSFVLIITALFIGLAVRDHVAARKARRSEVEDCKRLRATLNDIPLMPERDTA
jgi:hypothetical protein